MQPSSFTSQLSLLASTIDLNNSMPWLWRTAENYLDCGLQTRFSIESWTDPKTLNLESMPRTAINWRATALKIASYIIFLLPLIAVCITYAYRSSYSFSICDWNKICSSKEDTHVLFVGVLEEEEIPDMNIKLLERIGTNKHAPIYTFDPLSKKITIVKYFDDTSLARIPKVFDQVYVREPAIDRLYSSWKTFQQWLKPIKTSQLIVEAVTTPRKSVVNKADWAAFAQEVDALFIEHGLDNSEEPSLGKCIQYKFRKLRKNRIPVPSLKVLEEPLERQIQLELQKLFHIVFLDVNDDNLDHKIILKQDIESLAWVGEHPKAS